MPSNSENRTVIQDHWYTGTQMEDVGRAWENAGNNRLFLLTDESPEAAQASVDRLIASLEALPEHERQTAADAYVSNYMAQMTGRSGLESEHLQRIKAFPFKIMLPINLGNLHWVSLAITISQDGPRKKIDVDYSDSLGDGTIPPDISREIDRIQALFVQHFTEVNLTRRFYPHAWQQPDRSSCGAYSLKNAARCLDGKGSEPNPGRKAVREEQLDMMVNHTAIRECSTNNLIDKILIQWLIHAISNQIEYSPSSSEDLELIFAHDAEISGTSQQAVHNMFRKEYSTGEKCPINHLPILTRLRELLQSQEDLQAVANSDYYKKAITELKRGNAMLKMDAIRLAIKKATDDELQSYQLMASIIEHLAHRDTDSIKAILMSIMTDEKVLATCLHSIAELDGSRRIEDDFSFKLVALSSAYQSIHDLAKEVKTLPAATSTELLEGHIELLQTAIKRNSAPLVMQIVYAIKDFIVALGNFFASGRWEPDSRRFAAIAQQLKGDKSSASKEDYEKEIDRLNRLKDLQKEYRAQYVMGEDSPTPQRTK